MTAKIDVEKEFGARLYGRYREDGALSGQVFREEVLLPALKKNEKLKLDFSSVVAAPSSFFEEAFGGLIRELHDDPKLAQETGASSDGSVDLDGIVDALRARLELHSEDEFIAKKLEKVFPYMTIAVENIKDVGEED